VPDAGWLFLLSTSGNEHKSKGAHMRRFTSRHRRTVCWRSLWHVTVRGEGRKQAIEKALQFTSELQLRRNRIRSIREAGRYLRLPYGSLAPDSDLLVNSWQLMFCVQPGTRSSTCLTYIDEAMEFLQRCWDKLTASLLMRYRGRY